MTGVIALVILLIVVGVILYLVNQFVPMEPKVKQLLNVVIVAALAIYIIAKFLLPLLR